MKKRLLLFFLLFPLISFGQKVVRVYGVVVDSTLKVPLAKTAISVLNQKDSVMVDYAWADKQGSFTFSHLNAGSYIFLFTYPDYADFVSFMEIDPSQTEINFRNVYLTSKSKLLNEVIIKGRVNAITVKGDTTEFNARAYEIQPNAKVEDLLMQFPGFQVDSRGKITAQGQVIKKFLVDGEEFFSDDPTLITRNLRADMIDRVQLYDKKSDQAILTGVDDGIKEKTINLILKEDKKKGYFGKLEAGGGPYDFYQTQAMVNVFREREKFAIYGNLGNTGRTGLTSSENSKYGTDGGVIEFVSGGVVLTGSNADEIELGSGRYNGQGIPDSKTSGAHYDTKWNEGKESINANLKVGSLGVSGDRNTFSLNDLPSGLITNDQKQYFNNYNARERVDVAYQYNINPSQLLRIKVDAINKRVENFSSFNGETRDGLSNLLNFNTRELSSNGEQRALNMHAFFSKRFKKAGRSISFSLIQNMMDEGSDGFLTAKNAYFNSGTLVNTEEVKQLKEDSRGISAFNTNIQYSEPLSKRSTLAINYRVGLINNKVQKYSFNESEGGVFNDLDREFSNHFKIDQFSNQLGLALNYVLGKQNIQLNNRLTTVNLKQFDLLNRTNYNRRFLNYNPYLSYRYSISNTESLLFSFNGSNIQPSIEQIQPVRSNIDPLNIVEGNSNLKPGFSQDYQFSYNNFKSVSGLSLNLLSTFNLVSNPIIGAVNTDEFGKSVYTSVNSGKSTNYFVLRGGAGKQIKSISAYIGFSMYYDYRRDMGIINETLNERFSNSFTSSLQFSKSKAKKYDIMLNTGPRIFNGRSSLQGQLDNNGTGYDFNFTGNLFFLKKFEFRSNWNYSYQSKTASFHEPLNMFITDLSIGRRLLKDESLKFSILAKDIFNQNIGFNRRTFGTTISQTNFSTISRYFLFNLSWDFNRFGKSLVPAN